MGAGMTTPFAIPDWVPPWLALPLVLIGIVLTLAYLLMPFATFGVKARLRAMEARLDAIQGEIRSLSLRLPERREPEYDPYEEPPAERARAPRPESVPQRRPMIIRPPIPPRDEEDEPPYAPPGRGARRPEPPAPRPARTEPRLGPPR